MPKTSAGSPATHTFSQVPRADIPRSSFNRSHGYKTTFDSGLLIPVFVDEALPGDTFNLKATVFGRLATPKVPFLDNLFMDFFFFAVPNRLVWDNWQKFCGERTDPADILQSTEYLVPEVTAPDGGYGIQSLFDYLGIPPTVKCNVSALFPRAYNLIWNEWFRDQNLQDSLTVPKGDGPDAASAFTLQRRGKRHDYFTSSLPWPQKGPGVEIPLGTTAPVLGLPSGGIPKFVTASDYAATPAALALTEPGGNAGDFPVQLRGIAGPYADELVWAQTGLVADLSAATAATINSLRQAFQIQKLYERDARGGTRYVEILKSHFGVTSPDARLQRPEFLGGATVPISVNPVTQTSQTTSESPQGNLAAFGVYGGNVGFTKSFVEHCVIIGLVSVRADITYQQGIPRQFFRRSRWDFYWPALSHIGEQAVLQKEIYATGVEADDDQVWGYQERWAEYRYFPSMITGKFRSNNTTPSESLDVWHLAQNFVNAPKLMDLFIEEHPPIDRVVAVTSEPQLLFDSHWQIKCVRPMPSYSTPGFIDHF